MSVIQRSPISLVDFQESIREWYAQKSREFVSSKYQENELSRQFFLEERFEKLERKFARESQRLHRQFSQLSKSRQSSSGTLRRPSFTVKVDTMPKTDYITKHLNGYRRFEPTPELRPEYILFGTPPEEKEEEKREEEEEEVWGGEEFEEELSSSFPDIDVVHDECKQKFFDEIREATASALPNSVDVVVFEAGEQFKSSPKDEKEDVLASLLQAADIRQTHHTPETPAFDDLRVCTPTAFSNVSPAAQKRSMAFTTPARNPSLLFAGDGGGGSNSTVSNEVRLDDPRKSDAGEWGFYKTSTPLADTSKIPDFTFRPSDYGIVGSSSVTASPADSCRGTAESNKPTDTSDNNISNKSDYSIGQPNSALFTSSAADFGPRRGKGTIAANRTKMEKSIEYFSALSTPPTAEKSILKPVKTAVSPTLPEERKPKDGHDERQSADEIFDVNFLDGCAFAKWIQHFTTFNVELMTSVEAFERDTSQKQVRFALKRTIVDKINFSAKKKASNTDLAQVLSFFLSLFDHKTVVDSEGNELQMSAENKGMIDYAMFTISVRYIEQVKWDMDLMDTVVLVLVLICHKSKTFYKVLCAVILNSSVLLKMSISKILDKALSFSRQPPEAAALWISTERALFHLFFRVQLALKSTAARADGATILPHGVKGPALLHLFLEDVLELRAPVFCSSAFIVAELLNNCLRQITRASFKDGAKLAKASARWRESAKRICAYDWKTVLALISNRLKDENLETILRSRHEALLCVLKHSIEQKLIATS